MITELFQQSGEMAPGDIEQSANTLLESSPAVEERLLALWERGPEGKNLAVTTLTEQGVVWALARQGKGDVVWKIVSGVEPEQQTRILAVPGAAGALARSGLSDALWNLLEGLQPVFQARILGAPDAIEGLTRNGKAAEVCGLAAELLAGKKQHGNKPQAALGGGTRPGI